MNADVLVLGLGNTLLGDEGAGVHVVRYLLEQAPQAPGVRYLDGGTLSFALTDSIQSTDALIVIDAAELGAEAGTVRCYRDQEMDAFVGSNRKRSVHEVSLLDLLAVAALTDRLPKRRALVGIQPQSVDWSDTPTTCIAAAIPAAGQRVLELVSEWRQ